MKLLEINTHMKAYAIVVDCQNARAETFYHKFGFEVLNKNNDKVRMYISMATVEKLFSRKFNY